jgi:multidrug efflux pump subunit AcrB
MSELLQQEPQGLVVQVARQFLQGPRSALLIAAALLLGAVALLSTPQEEEPQIVVPMADVFVEVPGRGPREVEELVTRPLERILWQVTGVEHIYSTSRYDQSVVTVRFKVGEDRERALIKLRDQIESHRDLVPSAVTGWIVKPAQIDDVTVVALTLYSPQRTPFELRRIAEEVKARLDALPDLSQSEIIGGLPREIRIEAASETLASRRVSMADIQRALGGSEPGGDVGTVYGGGALLTLRPRLALDSAQAVSDTVIHSEAGRLVRVGDVATVTDGPAEPEAYHHIGFGPVAASNAATGRLPAVTLAFAKKKGMNAITVSRAVIAAAEALKGSLIPADVTVLATRDNGRSAQEKVDDLLSAMVFAIITVIALIAMTMGWRESIVIGVSVPITFALALFMNYLGGFTINRVTLFALILSLGLVVDDPISNVDNIQRHLRMGLRKPLLAAQWAVDEMAVPVVISTLTIIICFIPMFFITGMMGPYMRPMAVNVPLTIFFSGVSAITFVPWLTLKMLKNKAAASPQSVEEVTPFWIRAGYRRMLAPFLTRRRAWILLGVVTVLFVVSMLLPLVGAVPLKLLPFDNKDELQLVVDLPEGSTLEQTDRACQALESYLATVSEIRDFETYTGRNSPLDFNGLVRHYGFRRQPNQADIRINLAGKRQRAQQSHAIALRLRDDLTRIATGYRANLSIVEVPPGPPVLSTITAEVLGPAEVTYDQLIAAAQTLKVRMAAFDSHSIAQIDDYSETPRDRLTLVIDRDKAALHGLTPAAVSQAVAAAGGLRPLGTLHAKNSREPVQIQLRLPLAERSDPAQLEQLWLRTPQGSQVQIREVARFEREAVAQPVYRKDLERVVFVTAEAVGRAPAEIILGMQKLLKHAPLPHGATVRWKGEGEWQITVDVFRDLGIAFAVALFGIYLLLVLQTGSFMMPGVMMLAIPLTAIGIMPGFALLNAAAGSVGGYREPVFFTATAMIGMIALGGIVIRNSIVLIEFIQEALKLGKPLRQALLESGAVRFRPITLTALTAMLSAWPITLDPIFSGLAWALIFGLFASTAFTLLIIPTVFFLLKDPRGVEEGVSE